MTQLQAVRKFADYVAQEHVTLYRSPDDDWEFNMSTSKPRMGIPSNLTATDEQDKMFRIFFIQHCPIGRGFADITLSILHEIGHHFNREIYIFDTNMDVYNAAHDFDHFNLPCELAATNWAIEWLQDVEHRKIAKRFEKEFFGYGKE